MLPPRERFSAEGAGAIALQVATLAGPADLVVGSPPLAPPFPRLRFVAAPTPLLPGPTALARYGRGVAAALRPAAPQRIEVHNKPALARALRRRFPDAAVALHLHNDPLGMAGARTAAERAALARSVQVVCVSRFLAGRWGPEARVLPNAIDLADLPAPRPAGARRPRFAFAGRIVADKGADCFVAACAIALPRLPGWDAIMIGADRFGADSPDTPFLRALRPQAAAAGVAMTGYAPRPAVLAALAESAVAVVPSRWEEPFGMAALEAMACGAALVATGRGGLGEVVGDAALTVPAGDATALAAAMLRLAGDPEERGRRAAAGLARARTFAAGTVRAQLAALRADAA